MGKKKAAAQLLESLSAAGITHTARGKRRAAGGPAEAAVAPEAATVTPAAVVSSPKATKAVVSAAVPNVAPIAAAARRPTAASLMPLNSSDPWEVLRCEVAACQACHELAATRTQTVFGVGNLHPRLCFMGEAPGADEDQQGEPFVGAAGKLLNKIIEACHIQRSDVYILNILKCRPPGNRTPLPEEAGNCRGFLERQLALLKPEFICCLGACAAQNLLQTTTPIGRLRGQLHACGDIQVLCTYHPAYLLRNPAAKRDVWEDMKLLMREMGTPVE
jgi:uracil-DNA glycosylase